MKQCKFVYTSNFNKKSIEITPINIVFLQKYHQYAQVYITCFDNIEQPQNIKIPNLFTGTFIHCEKTSNNNIINMYFVNEHIDIKTNHPIFLNSTTSQIQTSFNYIENIENQSISLKTHYFKSQKKYIVIINQYQINSTIYNDKMEYQNQSGCGCKTIYFNQLDKTYIKNLITNILTNKYIIIKLLINIDIRMGDYIIHEKQCMRILYIYHNFYMKETIIKCYNQPNDITFGFIQTKIIPEYTEEKENFNIIHPSIVENQYNVNVYYK